METLAFEDFKLNDYLFEPLTIRHKVTQSTTDEPPTVTPWRPSAPKALNSHSSALGFQAVSNYLLGYAKFVVTNNYIFDRNLNAKYYLRKI